MWEQSEYLGAYGVKSWIDENKHQGIFEYYYVANQLIINMAYDTIHHIIIKRHGDMFDVSEESGISVAEELFGYSFNELTSVSTPNRMTLDGFVNKYQGKSFFLTKEDAAKHKGKQYAEELKNGTYKKFKDMFIEKRPEYLC